MLYWNMGHPVMKLIVDGEELTGPVYLAADGTITTNPGVAAKTSKKGGTKP
jgi:hypothetical protein